MNNKMKLHNPGGHEGVKGRKPKKCFFETSICENCGGITAKYFFEENGFPVSRYLCIKCDSELIKRINIDEEEREKRVDKFYNPNGKSILDYLLNK